MIFEKINYKKIVPGPKATNERQRIVCAQFSPTSLVRQIPSGRESRKLLYILALHYIISCIYVHIIYVYIIMISVHLMCEYIYYNIISDCEYY